MNCSAVWRLSLAILLTGISAATAHAANRVVHLVTPPPVYKDVAAMPEIADPADDAERAINTALKRLDRSILKAAQGCKGDGWSRSVDAPMTGPGFLSFTVTDSVFCDGNAHPDAGTFSIVYDLTTGKPVDWAKLLPASLVGKQNLEEQGDGTKIVTLTSDRLYALYLAGYRADEPPSDDLRVCKEAFQTEAKEAPIGMMVWLDAKAGGLAVEIGLAHVEAACEEPVVIPAATLRAEGASPVLLKAFDTK